MLLEIGLHAVPTRGFPRCFVAFTLYGMVRANEANSEPPDRRRCTGSSPTQRQRHPLELPVIVGTEGEKAVDIAPASRQDGLRDARSGVHEHGVDDERDHLPRRREGHPPLPRHPHRAARRALHLRRDRLPAHLRAPAEARGADALLHPAHAPLAHPRGHEAVLRRLPDHRAPHGHPLVDGVLALELLPRGARRPKHRAARHHHRAPALQGAHHRRVLVQEVDRAALRLPAELALLLRQLPQHDVLGPGRAVRDRRRSGAHAQPAPHPARRPRAELLHLHGAPRRQLAGQPVRLDRRRHLRALGPAPRRRQPRSRRDARADSRPTAAT